MPDLTPYELAAAFADAARRKCRSWAEDAERQAELDALAAEMDRRGVRMEDWDVTAR